jgi:aminoglycoside phosphotransferase (APT) family kinase protein
MTSLAEALAAWAAPDPIDGLTRLSGGASQETWAFARAGRPFILRRAPGGGGAARSGQAIPLATEAALIAAAARQGAPVAPVEAVFDPGTAIGEAFLMGRVEGETIARKILRDAAFAQARPRLARQCGQILARIHAAPLEGLPPLEASDGPDQLRRYEDIYRGFDRPRPVFELAFRWLADHAPAPLPACLVHGDFRNGNLMIGPDGVRAVLDWELAHLGDPREDLGWLCVNSWRFGERDKPAGGFGPVEDLIAGYAEAGGAPVSAADIAWWEMLGSLKWGVMCMIMYAACAAGADPSVERAAIGRRASEAEIDLVMLLSRLEAANA